MRQLLINKVRDDRNILFELTRKNIKSQYRGSVIGLVWTVLNPLLNTLIMYFVFSTIFNRNEYFILYLLAGNILFAALRSSTQQALESSVRNRGLLLRTKINQYVFPTSVCFSSIINFLFSLIALLPFMIYITANVGVNLFTYRLFFIVLMLPAFLLFELGLGLTLDALYVFFRDIKHIYGVFLTLWTYLTPIFYYIGDFIKKEPFLKTVVDLNPMYHFTNYFRDCIYAGAVGGIEKPTNIIYNPPFRELLLLYAIGVGCFIIGVIIYKCLKKKMRTRI